MVLNREIDRFEKFTDKNDSFCLSSFITGIQLAQQQLKSALDR